MSTREAFDGGPLADLEERKAIFAVLDSFRQYRRQTHFNTTHRRRQNFYALPKVQRNLLMGQPFCFLDWLNEVDDAIDENADIADAILNLALVTFGLPEQPEDGHEFNWHQTCRPGDMIKAHSTIRQFWRDWSAEGFAAEVKPILDLIMIDLETYVPLPSLGETDQVPSILLPGAGLGRVLFELCMAGYNSEGNEISYHQLLASNFILNSISSANQFRLFPFATSFTNQLSRSNQLKVATFPEIHPGHAIAEKMRSGTRIPGEMNMAAGDFITSYSSEENAQTFDGVITIYFIDTAPNLIRYIEIVRHCLKEGGIWVNVGPLLWHFDERIADKDESRKSEEVLEVSQTIPKPSLPGVNTDSTGIGEPGSFELSEEEVLALIAQMGFEILKHEILPAEVGGYIQDPESMMQSRFRCSHWVARKLS